MDKSEALRLADAIEKAIRPEASLPLGDWVRAAAELRRLHATVVAREEEIETHSAAVYEATRLLSEARTENASLAAALAQEQAGSWQDGVLEGHLRERERWLAQRAEPKGGGNLPPPLQAERVQEPVAWKLWDENLLADVEAAIRVAGETGVITTPKISKKVLTR